MNDWWHRGCKDYRTEDNMQTIITATRIRGTWTVRTAAGTGTGSTFSAALAGVQS